MRCTDSLYMVPALRAMDAPNPEAEGWTSVVLPAAYTNPTVFMGIAAAAAMHISVKNDPRRARFQPGAAFLYRSAVAAFSSDGHSTVKNTPHDKRMLMVASTMLLVCTRISQSRDFAPIMAAVYDAVNRAKDTLLSDDQDELCKFVSYQAMR